MIKANQKTKQIAFSLLQDLDFSCFSKDFLRSILTYLQLDETKICHKSVIAQKIAHIYQTYRNQYDIYLTLPKFKNLNSEAKDFLWSIFKQFDERWNQRKMMNSMQSKPMMSREHMNSHYMIPNQSMVNMFIDVPNLQSIEQIETFQRKMFQIYKNFMPQVLNSLHMTSGQYYRPQNAYHSYSINNAGSLSSISSISSINGMPPMNMGMNGYNNMNNRNNINGVAAMNPMYPQKPNEYYDSGSAYQNRYFYDNKMNNGYNNQEHNMQRNQKNIGNDFRPVSSTQNHLPSMGFSYYSQRSQQPEEFRPTFKEMGISFSQNKIPTQELQRKPIYSQKYFGDEPHYDNNYMIPNVNEYPMEADVSYYRNIQKEKQFGISNSTQIYFGQQPRKMVKKDDQAIISNTQLQDKVNKSLIGIETCRKNNNVHANICFHCKIIEIDPLNQVEEVLKLEAITTEVSQIKYIINKKTLEKVGKNPQKLDIELRCIRLEKQFDGCISWPDKARLSVDEEVVEHVSQVQSKKRKDKPFIFSKYYGNQKNSQETVQILLQIVKGTEKSAIINYLFGVFIVIKHSVKQMQEIILKNIPQLNIDSFFGSKKLTRSEQGGGESICIQCLDISTKKLITIPVRGVECSHPQCFDLDDFLSLLFISPCRQWKCPICSEEAKKFYIDTEVRKVMNDVKKMIKQPKEIVFYYNGTKTYNFNEEEGQGNELQREKIEHREKRLGSELGKVN